MFSVKIITIFGPKVNNSLTDVLHDSLSNDYKITFFEKKITLSLSNHRIIAIFRHF